MGQVWDKMLAEQNVNICYKGINSSNGYLTTFAQRKMGCRNAKTRERKKNTKYALPNGAIMQSKLNIIQPESLGGGGTGEHFIVGLLTPNVQCLFVHAVFKCRIGW